MIRVLVGVLLSYLWLGVVFALFRPRFRYRLGLVICWPWYVVGYLEGWIGSNGHGLLWQIVTLRIRLAGARIRNRFRSRPAR